MLTVAVGHWRRGRRGRGRRRGRRRGVRRVGSQTCACRIEEGKHIRSGLRYAGHPVRLAWFHKTNVILEQSKHARSKAHQSMCRRREGAGEGAAEGEGEAAGAARTRRNRSCHSPQRRRRHRSTSEGEGEAAGEGVEAAAGAARSCRSGSPEARRRRRPSGGGEGGGGVVKLRYNPAAAGSCPLALVTCCQAQARVLADDCSALRPPPLPLIGRRQRWQPSVSANRNHLCDFRAFMGAQPPCLFCSIAGASKASV